MGAYFPDFALRVKPDSALLNNLSDSTFRYVVIPSVKLWARSTRFSAAVSPTPPAGTITLSFLHRSLNNPLDSLTAYPDSLRLRIRTSGGVTPGNYSVTVKANGPNGTPVHTRIVYLTVVDFTGISNNNNEVPEKFYLYQNYPNPFNPVTRIRVDIPSVASGPRTDIRLVVFDLLGRHVETIHESTLQPGSYETEWNAADYPSGIYFYKLTAGDYSAVRKMILIK
jgi:hypothetical protein